jgi:hypothetical protein
MGPVLASGTGKPPATPSSKGTKQQKYSAVSPGNRALLESDPSQVQPGVFLTYEKAQKAVIGKSFASHKSFTDSAEAFKWSLELDEESLAVGDGRLDFPPELLALCNERDSNTKQGGDGRIEINLGDTSADLHAAAALDVDASLESRKQRKLTELADATQNENRQLDATLAGPSSGPSTKNAAEKGKISVPAVSHSEQIRAGVTYLDNLIVAINRNSAKADNLELIVTVRRVNTARLLDMCGNHG